MRLWLLAVAGLLLIPSYLFGQSTFKGDSLVYTRQGGKELRRVIGHVTLDQADQTLYADVAEEYIGEKIFKFIGHVRIVQKPDGAVITADTLYYDKTTRFATLIGNVHLVDKETDLKTDKLYYSSLNGTAWYNSGAEIKDANSLMTSRYGEYNRNTRTFYFNGDVDVKSEEGKLQTDTLRYFSDTKTARFYGPTTITNKDGVVKSGSGEYNTETKESKFFGRSRLDNKDYILEGDIVNVDRSKGKGYAKGDVIMTSKKDSLTIYGDEGRFDNQTGYSKIWGRAKVKMLTSGDSLFLTADTLLSTDQNDSTKRRLRAWHRVMLFKKDLQGAADSLSYSAADSQIRMFFRPVLWSEKNQITGDSINLFMKQKRPERLWVRPNAFIAQEDTLRNYNQLKGRQINAYFRASKLHYVVAEGNCQNLFFALEKDTMLTGMNRVSCSDMTAYFDSLGKMSTIHFRKQPEAAFIPPHELTSADERLKGFTWRPKERPTLALIQALRAKSASKKQPRPIKKRQKLTPRATLKSKKGVKYG